MLYRIYAANIFPMDVAPILRDRGIQSFSMIKQEGYWRGVPEASVVIDVFDENGELENRIYAAAEDIRALGNQEIVYVIEFQAHAVRSIKQSLDIGF
jgi:hypothetical protein